jgi:hypothetical protein
VTRVPVAALRWLVVAIMALLAAWLLAPAAVPLYDGLSAPDEPYRYVQPPAHAKTVKPPTVASGTVSVRNGVSGAQYANSGETGPQISLYLPAGALRVPAGATSITATATPTAPAPPLPTDGRIITNVYRVAAHAGSTAVEVIGTGRQEPTLQMRAPSAKQPGPVFEHRTATGWERLHTIRAGNDIYQAQAPELGDYALVQLAQSRQSSGTGGGGGGGVNIGLLTGGLALLVASVSVVTIRTGRTRRKAG